jgi:cysteine dioxygenase
MLGEQGHLLASDIPQPEEHSYGRKVLFANDYLEVILVHLPAFTATRIHDHGQSIGAALVLEGQLTNTLYSQDESGSIHPYEEQCVEKDQLFIAAHNQIHQMINLKDKRTVSLHVYAPPLSGIQVYD